MGQRSSVYLADDLAAAVKASGVPLAELVRRGLRREQGRGSSPAPPSPAAVASLAALPEGEPSDGTLCMGPGCFQRDTRTYGLRDLPLCTACAAALQGETYRREVPPGAARVIHRGAA